MIKILLILLLSISCDKNIESYRVKKVPINVIPVPIENDSTSDSDLKWDTPKGWLQSSGSKMRLASFSVPYIGGYGDLSIMLLHGDGGGIEANINRWRRQIDLNPQNLSNINKTAELRNNGWGGYQIFEVVNLDNKDKAFVCAIMPSKDSTIFVKLSMSAEGITEIKDDFLFFCDSFKFRNE